MDNHLISIIMPTFNRGYIIENAIQSVFEQTILNWELIIVDDASTDNTEDIVKNFTDSRVIYIRNEENMGANYSRNRGCTIAKGDFLAFLDSDNVWSRNKLKIQLGALLDSVNDVAFAFSKVEVINQKRTIVVPDIDFDSNHLEKVLHNKNVIDTNTVLLKRSVFETVGGFDNDMPRLQDWDIFFRIIAICHYRAIYIPEILDCNIIQSNSISNNDYKYQISISIFLKKYSEYLDVEEINRHFISLLKITKDKEEAILFMSQYLDNKEGRIDKLYVALAEQFYRYSRYYNILRLWKENMEKRLGRTIFPLDLGWRNLVIALYGLGQWGDLIYTEMKNCGLKLTYGIDKRVKEFHDLNVITIQEIPVSVNLIIVSVINEFDEICNELSQYYSGKILSIEELVSDVRFEKNN